MWFFGIVFIGIYLLINYYIGHRGWNTFGRLIPRINRWTYWTLFLLVAFSFPAAELGEDLLPAPFGLWFTMAGGYWLVAMLYLFLIILFIDILRVLDKGLGLFPAVLKESEKTPLHLGLTIFILVAAALMYGTWNARNPVVTNYELTVNKKAGDLQQLRIAMVSDIHYGAIINTERLNKMVEIINELKPDIIVFAGDIMEGNVEPAEARKMIDLMKQMQDRYGKFAVAGNHDRMLRADNEILGYFEEAGIKVLKDNYLRVNDSFYVVGRDDPGHRSERSRKALAALMEGVDSSLPVILLDHQPIDLAKAREKDVDIQLAGHTHRGQIFPNQLITGQIYELDWGLLKKGNHHLIVSSGYGTWGPPVRIGNNPEVVNIDVKFR